MEVSKCINERRSVKKYLNKDIPLKIILQDKHLLQEIYKIGDL
jgi:nitroreductase